MKLTTGQIIALDHCLSEYDIDQNFGDLQNDIRTGSYELTGVWEKFESLSDEDLANFLCNLSESIDQAVNESKVKVS